MGRARGGARRAGDRPEKLGRDGVRRLGELYRAAAADLAFARRRFPGEAQTARLEALVLRARATVYARVGRRASSGSFFDARLLAAARGAAGAVLVAWTLLLAPALAGGAWGAVRRRPPRRVWSRREFQSAADPPVEGRDFDAADGRRRSRSRSCSTTSR